jgi:hypothetical protein
VTKTEYNLAEQAQYSLRKAVQALETLQSNLAWFNTVTQLSPTLDDFAKYFSFVQPDEVGVGMTHDFIRWTEEGFNNTEPIAGPAHQYVLELAVVS